MYNKLVTFYRTTNDIKIHVSLKSNFADATFTAKKSTKNQLLDFSNDKRYVQGVWTRQLSFFRVTYRATSEASSRNLHPALKRYENNVYKPGVVVSARNNARQYERPSLYVDFNVFPMIEQDASKFEVKTMHSVRFYIPSDVGRVIGQSVVDALIKLCKSKLIDIASEDIKGTRFGSRFEIVMASTGEDEVSRARVLVDELLVFRRFQLSEHQFNCVDTACGLL